MKAVRSTEHPHTWNLATSRMPILGIPGISRNAVDDGWVVTDSGVKTKHFKDTKYSNSIRSSYLAAAKYIFETRGDRKFTISGRLENTKLTNDTKALFGLSERSINLTYKGSFITQPVRGQYSQNGDIHVIYQHNGVFEHLGTVYSSDLSDFMYSKVVEAHDIYRELTTSEEYERRLADLVAAANKAAVK